jgi:predicted acyl esterase
MFARRAAWLCLVLVQSAFAQQIEFPAAAAKDDATLVAAMPSVAERLLAVQPPGNETDVLENRFRLELLAGRYVDAQKTFRALREARPGSSLATLANVRWEIYAAARLREAAERSSFDDAFKASFRESLRQLNDRDAYRVLWSFGTSVIALENGLRDALGRLDGATTISTAQGLDIARRYLSVQVYRSFRSVIAELSDEDDRRRYVIENDIAIRMADGGTVCALVARPRAPAALPTLLNFTIYADRNNNLNEVRRAASNGFAGVVALTRGKGCSPDKPAVPYLTDGRDAAAVIDWISAKTWSDGRVGMYGGSYEGFTAWAAAKRIPKALKGIMAGAPVAPGIDVPMEGNVFWNFVYPWPFYTTNTKYLDDATYNESERWTRLDRNLYVSGRAYRDLEKIDGAPNPIFDQWIAHPTYDTYWRGLIPDKNEFARIDIPVLSTAGYYFGGPGAAVHYFTEHYRHNSRAEHYLVIGPYDHVRGHSGTVGVLGSKWTTLAGYELDPAAQLDMAELRYQWFDYVFKRGPRPALVTDKVNYEVMGANVWKHASSIAAMANQKLRLHLTAARTLTVNLADRTDVDRQVPGGGVVDKSIDTANAVMFVSEPLQARTEVSGLFSGHLDFVTNKKDFDFNISVYEQTSSGNYIQLAPYWARASHVRDLARRQLLQPGKRQRLDFRSTRLISRQMEAGSRIVAVLSVIKEPGRQINYGTGKDVSDETIADAGEPLQIEWSRESFIEMPVRR